MASPMVAALTSTTSSLLVNLRSGVGIRTFFAINLWVHNGAVVGREDTLKFAEAGFDFARVAGVAVDRIQRFQAIAGDAQHDGILSGNFARSNQLPRHAHRNAAGGLSENAFGLRE